MAAAHQTYQPDRDAKASTAVADSTPNRNEQTRTAIIALVKQYGTAQAARLLGMRRDTIVAICSGVRLMPGTLALARERLAMLPTDSSPTT